MTSVLTTFLYSGGQQTYTVPAGVYNIMVRAQGAAGGTATANRGYGGYCLTYLPVTPGTVIYVNSGGYSTGTAGGWNGGGAAAAGTHAVGGGGGASDIRIGGTALVNRKVIGGGGGGGSTGGGKGGGGGGLVGQAGGSGLPSGGGGTGATQTTGYAGGIGGSAVVGPYGYGAPGGGGGWYGGFAGANASGAGGGSAHADATALYPTYGSNMYNSHGVVQITSYKPVAAPTSVGPVSSTNIPNPILTATLVSPDGQLQRAEWQFATDAGFTTGLKVVTEPPGSRGPNDGRRVSGVTAYSPTITQLKLSSGTWYVRARGIDLFGVAGPYSAGNLFTVTHPPTAYNQAPSANIGILFAPTIPFSWVFTDPWTGDTQTAYQVIVEENDSGVLIYDTGKVVSTSNAVSITIPSVEKDIVLRWSLKVWDSENVAGDFTNYRLFRVTDPPVVGITYPTAGGNVDSGAPMITWTVDAINPAVAYMVVFYNADKSQVLFNSGTIKGTNLSYAPPVTILSNSNTYQVVVLIQDSDGFWGSDTHTFGTAYVAPDPVLYTTENLYDTLGYVNIDWSQSPADSSFLTWRVYRAIAGSYQWEKIFETTDINRTNYHDWTAASGQTYGYSVVQQAYRSGILLESDGNPFAVQQTLISSDYWLLNLNDETKNLLLYSVVSDSYSEEIEEESFILIDRGRKKNYGTSLGMSGSLTVHLRDRVDISARQQRINLIALQQSKSTYQMRDPFGNLSLVGVGNIGVERLSGVGSSEFCNVTIPYTEVCGNIPSQLELIPVSIPSGTGPVNVAPVLNASTPPSTGVVGTVISYNFTTSIGTPAPTYSITAGALPTGLTLNAATGLLSGTLTTVGSFTYTVAAHNTTAPDATVARTMTVVAAGVAPVISTVSLPGGTCQVAYSTQLAVSAGTAPVTYTISSGSIPGLTMSSTGLLSGTPTVAGSSTISITASNATSPSSIKQFTIAIAVAAGTGGTALWTGNYQSGFNTGWVVDNGQYSRPSQLAIVTTPARAGYPSTARYIVANGDYTNGGTSAERAELRASIADTGNPVNGQTMWWGYSFYLASYQTLYGWGWAVDDDPDSIGGNGWIVFTQWHGDDVVAGPNGPNIDFGMTKGTANPYFVVETLGDTSSTFNMSANPIPLDTWVDMYVGITWGLTAGVGRLTVEMNGVNIVNNLACQNLFTGQSAYLKQGIYRGVSARPQTIYYTGTKRGATRADVLL